MLHKRALRCSWVVDVLLAVIVVLIIALVEYGILPNYKAGFYCGDPKISFRNDGDTITIEILLSGAFIIPLVVIWLVETFCLPSDKSDECRSLKDRAVAGFLEGVRWYLGYLIGLAVVVFVTEVAKVVMGEPRPHFLYTCRPDKARTCTPGSYVSDYRCTNTEDNFWDVSDANKSFPSGHSSMSFFLSVFLMWYVQVRVPGDVTLLLVPWLHCLLVTWGIACAITRITDHRHHWWDVLVGSLLGIGGAVFTVKLVCGGFLKKDRKSRSKIDDDSCESGQV